MTTLTYTDKDFAAMTMEDVAQIASRLENDDYKTPFEGLQDWHKLRAIAFHREDLIEPYFYLLDIEAYDES
ncbi:MULTISPECIES: protein IsiD [unclassified Cyanobacterium]|uniref:protein IsiD n=1 Tax=unclassified Cyanobacterium TaxID=2629879 RepID=UPI0008527110|nr:DUF2555 domain-containing protein [Cyanobacterium sp. IPPAS B-1200]OEJ80145.1 hypothetical protein A5482_07195 [Cyanobacterium sp. IPPAS B-1200]